MESIPLTSKRTKCVCAGKPLSTDQINKQASIEYEERVSLIGPYGMFPDSPKEGDYATFVYKYKPCGWVQSRVEVVRDAPIK